MLGQRRTPLNDAILSLVIAGMACVTAPAFAQNLPPPKFETPTPPAEDAPKLTAQAKGSLLVTTGNSRSRNGVLGFLGARQAGKDRSMLEAQVAYGTSSVVVPQTDPANPLQIVGLDRRDETTTRQWQARVRQDRFFSERDAGYLLAQVASDEIAGKALGGGAQLGYSRHLLKGERHALVAELGYDFSYERYVETPGKTADPVQIHSARFFLGEQLTLSEATSLTAGLEALVNLNEEDALDASDPSKREVAPLKDTRLLGKLGLNTKLWRNLSFGFGVTVKYDQNPAPRPLPSAAKGATFAPSFQPFADKIDTLTEATLVLTFL